MGLNKTSAELRKIRGLLFPAIGIQIITGFNIYPASDSFYCDDCAVKISYLHEDLLEGRPHYEEIKSMLQKYCDQIKVQRIEHEAINRFSSYNLEEGWRADRYFLVDQTPVKEEDVDELIRQKITVVGCGKQNELIIKCEQDSMEYILEQFRLHANKYEINPDIGNFVLVAGTNTRKLNQNKLWTNAWEVPTIIVYARDINKIKAYEKAKSISLDLPDGIVNLVIGNKWNKSYAQSKPETLFIPSFEEYLISKDFSSFRIDNNHFANKIFFDWINKIDWARVKRTIELHADLFET